MNFNQYDIKNLVLSGGGIKGISYIGVLRFFEENNTNINNITASSIGCVFSLLYILGYTSKELENLFMLKDFSELLKPNIKFLLKKFGMTDGKEFMSFIETLLRIKNINKDITFQELFYVCQKEITFVGYNLNQCENCYFSVSKTPSVKVLEALRMCVSIPYVFFPTKDTKGDYIIDGGIFTDCDIKNKEIEDTLCISLANRQLVNDINSFSDYNNAIMKSCFKLTRIFQEKYHIIYIKVENVQPIDTKIDNETKKVLIENGYLSISRFFHCIRGP